MEPKGGEFRLPIGVVGRVDIGRLLRELEALDNFLLQAGAGGHKHAATLPKTSYSLEGIAGQNGLKLLAKPDRLTLKKQLETVRASAPVVHISFAAEPPPAFLQKIIGWFRSEIHPMLLLQVGLQPDIAAGCIVRTPNHYFDFSLRRNLYQKRSVLIDGLHTGATP